MIGRFDYKRIKVLSCYARKGFKPLNYHIFFPFIAPVDPYHKLTVTHLVSRIKRYIIHIVMNIGIFC